MTIGTIHQLTLVVFRRFYLIRIRKDLKNPRTNVRGILTLLPALY